MKTYNPKWNVGYFPPKRDIDCLDMEDWTESDLKKLSTSKPDYPNFVTPDMIVESSYVADNLVIDGSYTSEKNDCKDKDYPEQNVTPLSLQDLVKMRDDFRKTSDDRWADELDEVINEYN